MEILSLAFENTRFFTAVKTAVEIRVLIIQIIFLSVETAKTIVATIIN